MSSNRAVLGLLATRAQTDSAVDALRRMGFARRDISVLVPDTRDSTHEYTMAPQGGVAGVGAGSVLGGTLGLLLGIGGLAIPGLAPLGAASPMLAALCGATVGAVAGGLGGALIGKGIPQRRALPFDGRRAGNHVLVSVHVEDGARCDRAKSVLEHQGATIIATIDDDLPGS